MKCKKCGKLIPPGSNICPYCGTIQDQEFNESLNKVKVNLLSDKYGVDKSVIYQDNALKPRNKFTGVAIIIGILLIIIFLVIITYIGR